jgi:hypothetical protein
VPFDGYGPVSALRGWRDFFRDHGHLRAGFILCGVALGVACIGGALVMAGLPWGALPVYVVAAAILTTALVRLIRDARAGNPTAP